MKYLYYTIFIFSLCISGCNNNSNISLMNNSIKNSNEQSPSTLINIRNVQTGGIIINLQGEDFNRNNWALREVHVPGLDLVHNPSGFVQFLNPDGNECLSVSGQHISVTDNCSPNNKSSLFTMIPSTSGAVQIKSISSNLCITNGIGIIDFRLGPCVDNLATPSKVIDTGRLWMINPPIAPAKLSPAL